MGQVFKQTVTGVKWSSLETFSLKFIQFVVSVCLARLLTPDDFGLLGMIAIFMVVTSTFVDSGMTSALIRQKEIKDEDFNTVFVFNIGMSCLAYVLLFFAAPFIADFFGYSQLTLIVRVLSLNIVIGSFGGVIGPRYTMMLDFKTLAKFSTIASIGSAVIAIAMAYTGFGVWALVAQSLSGTLIALILKWSISPWHPRLKWSKKSFKALFGYGNKLLMSNLLHNIYDNSTSLIIGKFYTPADLGFFYRGYNLPSLVSGTMLSPVDRVCFPIMAKLQDDKERLISVYRKYIKVMSIPIIFGLMLIAALAEPIVVILFTEKWLPAVPFLQLCCFMFMTDHVCRLNLSLLQIVGRSDLFLRLEVIKKTISLTMLLAAVPFGVMAICLMKIVYAQIAVVINTYYTRKLFDLGYWKQIRDFGPYIIYSALACTPAYIGTLIGINPWGICILGGLIAVGLMLGILKTFKDSIFEEYFMGLLLPRIKKAVSRTGNSRSAIPDPD